MRHHYLPQFYSKNWMNSEGKIHCYKFINGKIQEDLWAPKGTGYEPNLYSIEHEDPHKIETQHFKVLDDKASKILHKILNNGLTHINTNEKEQWCDFITSLITRHTKIVGQARKSKEPIIDDLVNGVPQKHRQEFVSSPQVRDFCDNIHTYVIASFSGFDELYNIGLNEKYRQCLIGLNWFVLDFINTGFDLLTSDYPVCIFPLNKQILHSKKYETPREMLASGDFYLSFPLSPTRCFYAGKVEHKKGITKSQLRHLIKLQNHITINNAQKIIYSNNGLSINFLKKYFNR
ncbi:hypothetical protein Lsan_1407 [Legionella santicrucis]|uniref:DUF4238 domain-containing protein n=1 Tax=Legionella santicrucis TaxID=45074 RepID=A0A0W0Z2E0_9GAMM|nr:DUF4238 domain-containing protein [Legionella santicrucis]KTD63289.1 hypothetical protein Lsan_1407 [Legionella santicrucis]